MHTNTTFHGSDLEKIEEVYHIPKESIVRFAANVNPLGLSQRVKEALCNHLEILSTYPDRDYRALRQAIANYCHVSAHQIVVGNGSTELISLMIEHLSPKKALLLGPTYSEYARELSLCNCSLEMFYLKEEDQFQLDIECFSQVLNQGYDLLILCNPNNPTSSALSTKELSVLLSACKTHGISVMIDETYIEFATNVPATTAVSLTQTFDNLYVLRGVSKFFAAPGIRLGYAITSNEAMLERIRSHQIPWSLNSVGAFVGEQLFQDTAFMEESRTLILSERVRMYQELKQMDGVKVYPGEANFLLVRITKPNLTSADVFTACIKEGLMIRDCSSFDGLEGEFIRFCIMHPSDNTKLLQTIARTVQQHRI